MSFDLDGDRAVLWPSNTAEAHWLSDFSRQISAAGFDVRIDVRGDQFRVLIPLVERPNKTPKSNGDIEHV